MSPIGRSLWTVVLTGLAAGASFVHAEPWFGVKPPADREARSLRDRAVYAQADLPPLSLQRSEPDPRYSDIDGPTLMGDLGALVERTHAARPAGTPYWGRIAGTPAERAAAEYLADRFGKFGLRDVRLEPVPGGPQWWPVSWAVTLLGEASYGEGTADLPLTSAFPALHLGEGALDVAGLEAELVYVGLGRPADIADRALDGKIAVLQSVLQPDPFFQSARGRAEALIAAGARAVLTLVDGPGNHQYALEGMGPATTPNFVIGGDDGRFLVDVLGRAGVATQIRARLELQAEVRPGWQGWNVVGRIPGRTAACVLVVAHLDGYFEGANDNAGGLAALLGLARHYAHREEPPARNLIFVGTAGHHEFSDGVRAFIAAHPPIMRETVLVMNIEHPASILSYYRGPLTLGRASVPGQLVATTGQSLRALTISNGSPALLGIYREAIDRYGLVVDLMVSRRPTGDAFDFARAGTPVVQILDTNLWYHSSGDRLDTIDAAGLARATRLYAHVLDQIDALPAEAIEARSRSDAR